MKRSIRTLKSAEVEEAKEEGHRVEGHLAEGHQVEDLRTEEKLAHRDPQAHLARRVAARLPLHHPARHTEVVATTLAVLLRPTLQACALL